VTRAAPRVGLALACATLMCGACDDDLEDVARPRTLAPYPNPFGRDEPQYAPQPRRDKPTAVIAAPDGRRAFIALTGTEDEPGRHVLEIDPRALRVVRRIEVGSGPCALALHPSGALLVVASRFSNHLTVIDTDTGEVVHRPAADFYTSALAFSPGGDELWLANRWRDAAFVWPVGRAGRGLHIASRDAPALPTAANPRELAISDDGTTVAVGAPTGLGVTLIERQRRRLIAQVDLGAPVNGLAFAGRWLVVATLSRATHHLPLAGPDTDGDGQPGDGTPNVNFQDLQNELAVLDTTDGREVHRYTSDTICCRDFRDVAPDDLARGGALLPPRDQWIVGGALPEQLIAFPDDQGERFQIWVSYSASNQLQRFTLDARDGALAPGPVIDSHGHSPYGLARAADRLLVTHRLGDSLATFSLISGEHLGTLALGARDAPTYPATDAELGELFNFVTAPYTVDGDQSCSHCHRDNGNIAKAFSMPLTLRPGVGLRQTMAYRGAADTRPWFFEAAMDEHNFKPVTNEFARIENYCCSDYTLWPDGAPADCATHPPPECEATTSPGSLDGFDASRAPVAMVHAHPRPLAAPSRDAHFLEASASLLGRRASFGDGLFFEDLLTGERRPIALDFDGMTRALGLFLLTRPRLLPNPNDPASSAVLRGQALFESAETACATCHPAPTFAVSTTHNPLALPLLFGPVVSPLRDADGHNLDLLSDGFAATFPRARSDSCQEICGASACDVDPIACDDLRNVHLGVPSLRGIWDRAPRFLHDGRARSLREVLCTPGHPALLAGEIGYNERDGIPDTHGGTSHLDPRDIADLISYLESL